MNEIEEEKCCSTIMRVIKRPPKGTALKPPPGLESLNDLGYIEGQYVKVKIVPLDEIEAKSLIQAERTKSRLIRQKSQEPKISEENIKLNKEILDKNIFVEETKPRKNILDDLIGGN